MSEPTELELAIAERAAWAMIDDQDLLALIASYAYCYSVFRETPDELLRAFDVAANRGLLDTTL